MARPKPPEEFDLLTVRLPMSQAQDLRELAKKSRNAKGQEMSGNQYCVAILAQAVEAGITVHERSIYDFSQPLEGAALVREPDNEE